MKKLLLCNAFALILIGLCACSDGHTVAQADKACDTVLFAKVGLSDTLTYSILETKCDIQANVDISYPQKYVDNVKTESLQRLFTNVVLNIPGDSVSLASAFPLYVEHLMTTYREGDRAVSAEDIESDFELVQNCQLVVKIYDVYNKNGLMCVCKEERVQINEALPEVQHFYYTFDLEKLSRMRMSDMFDELKINALTEMLKKKLLKDMGAASYDELVDLGLYNLDNLSAVDNFYVSDDSIIWNYLPRELAVQDEVRVALSKERVLMINE